MPTWPSTRQRRVPRGVAGVVLQVLPSPSPHLQSCFMSIYRLVFDLRFSAKRDLYETVDIVFLPSPLLRRSRTSAAPSRSSTACATASCPCPIRRRSSRSFRRICGTSVCLWWEWVVHVRRSPPPVITTSSCFARPGSLFANHLLDFLCGEEARA